MASFYMRDDSGERSSSRDTRASSPPPANTPIMRPPIMEINEIERGLSELYQSFREDGGANRAEPCIVVCGGQSAGKSSVLEAITEIPFPSGGGLTTRFITKIVTKNSPQSKTVKVRIIPSQETKLKDEARAGDLTRFQPKFDLTSDNLRETFPALMSGASDVILGTGTKNQITSDILELTLAGPTYKNLTLVDLPGLIGSDGNEGTKKRIEDMTLDQIRNRHSLVLCVIEATVDSDRGQGTEIWDLCTRGNMDISARSICVLTRPDIADTMENKSNGWVQTIKEGSPHFKGRWHVLRNYTQSTGRALRLQEEERFFANTSSQWNKVESKFRGASNLRERLEMWQSIERRKYLPSMRAKLNEDLAKISVQLEALESRADASRYEQALRKMLERFKKWASAHSKGELYGYDLNSKRPDGSGPCHLRARINDEEINFRDSLMMYGYHSKSYISSETFNPNGQGYKPKATKTTTLRPTDWENWTETPWQSLEDEVEDYKLKMQDRQGEASSRFSDFRVIGLFYQELSQKWMTISKHHLENMAKRAKAYFDAIAVLYMEHCDDEGPSLMSLGVAQAFVKLYIHPKIDQRFEEAKEELKRLETDRTAILVSNDPKIIDAQRQIQAERDFVQRERALRLEKTEPQDPSKAAGFHYPMRLLKYNGRFFDADQAYQDAYIFAAVAYKNLEAGRDVWATNVVYQVFERHLFRDFGGVVIDPADMKEKIKTQVLFCKGHEEDKQKIQQLSREKTRLDDLLKKVNDRLSGLGTDTVGWE